MHVWSRCTLADSMLRQAFTEQRHGKLARRPASMTDSNHPGLFCVSSTKDCAHPSVYRS